MQASTSEKIVTYSALALSLCAFVISLIEVYTMRQQTKTAVWPRIQLTTTSTYEVQLNPETGDTLGVDLSYTFLATNVGLGPTLIEDFYLWLDGVPVRSWQQLFQKLGTPAPGRQSRTRTRDRTLLPGQDIVVFTFSGPQGYDSIQVAESRIDIGTCYASVYGDRWYTRRNLLATSEIEYVECDRCPWPDSLALRAD